MKGSGTVIVALVAMVIGTVGCADAPSTAEEAVGEAGCPEKSDLATEIDWVPFVMFDDRTYLEVSVDEDEPRLRAAQLGEPVAQTRCKLAEVVDEPGYVAQNGDAAFLAPGTELVAVEGFDPGFRVAAEVGGELKLFEVDTAPDAERGADILGDIAGRVTTINVNSEMDGVTVLGRIRHQERIDELVNMVLDAPVDPDAHGTGTALRYFVEFELDDAPPVTMVLFVDDRILGRGFQVPAEFVDAIHGVASGS